MFRFIYILLFIIVLEGYSCNSGNKNNIIDDDSFIKILKDFHKAEGIISIAHLNAKKSKKDTTSLYNYILKKHNVSREEFERTLRYYANHTTEYVIFYDSINKYFLSQKKELEAEINENIKKMSFKEQFASKNLWTKKQEFIFKSSKNTKNISFDFNIKAKYNGKYIIKFDIFTDPDIGDNIEKRISLFANYKDGSIDSTTSKTIKRSNKKFKHVEVAIKTNKNKKLKSISGNVLSFSKQEDIFFHIKNIEIKYIFNKRRKKKIKKDLLNKI